MPLPLSEITQGAAEAFDEIRAAGATLELLIPSNDAQEYTTLLTIYSGWFFDYERLELSIADSSAAMKAAVKAMTHFRINGTVYPMMNAPAPIEGTNFFYAIRADTFSYKREFGSIR